MNSQSRQNRPRARSGFSFRSSSSGGRSSKKEPLTETAAEKRKAQMSETTKANPNAAINEAQPIALALEKPTLVSLQNIRCNDVYGNPINDPDRSNPTRWRMERPLETIRSFEVAIDKGFAQRQSAYAAPAVPTGNQSQRNSSNWGNNNGYDQSGRFSTVSGNGGYGNSRDSFGEGGYSGHPMRSNPRMQSEPTLNRYGAQGNVYPVVGDARSKDTLHTGASSGSEQYRESPHASEESSLERVNGIARPLPVQPNSGYSQDTYGNQQYSDDERGYQRGYPPRYPVPMGPSASTPQLPNNMGYSNSGISNGYYQANQPMVAPPRPPPKEGRLPTQSKNPIRLNDTKSGSGSQPQQPTSWLKKRFSRSAK